MDELGIDREALLQTFLEEAEETFVHMEQSLVALESRPDDDAAAPRAVPGRAHA